MLAKDHLNRRSLLLASYQQVSTAILSILIRQFNQLERIQTQWQSLQRLLAEVFALKSKQKDPQHKAASKEMSWLLMGCQMGHTCQCSTPMVVQLFIPMR